MKLSIFVLLFFLMAFPLVAQVEGKPKSTAIPAVENKDEKKEPTPTPLIIKPESKPSLTNTSKENMSGIKVTTPNVKNPNKEFSMIDNSTLINPSKIFEKKWEDEKRKKQLELYENVPPELLGDQFLGDFKTSSEFANVICRDFGEEDGDLIKVLLNDEIIIVQLQLTNGYKSFKIPLAQGINKIDFYALNQGLVGFNTAEFQLYDDKEDVISKNNWYLATGKKASLILVKE